MLKTNEKFKKLVLCGIKVVSGEKEGGWKWYQLMRTVILWDRGAGHPFYVLLGSFI
jgi:hypothetical protein